MWGPRPFCTITGLKTSGVAAACLGAGVRRAVRTAGAAPTSAVAHPPIVSAPECRRNVRRCIGPDAKVRECVGPDTLLCRAAACAPTARSVEADYRSASTYIMPQLSPKHVSLHL